ncbi:ABC transporter permease [Oleomonas cavernae]|uniref:ABC transporter permease n=1 Tax=Oleomonas cavernae TaxID=2320859 RepID=A0A418W8M6_9PROT|nr:ABC transporter permease [Oleomonas cavernae]RJF86363.1 ABC transporter permease [Oleomonas cavernae]
MTMILSNRATAQTKVAAVIKKPRGKTWRDYSVTVGTIVVLLVLWEIVARQTNPILLAPPTKVVAALITMIGDGTIGKALLASAKPFATGFVAAVVVGVPLGLLIGRFRYVEAALGWFIIVGYAMPMIALVPVFMLWFGLGFVVKAVMVATMTVFAIVINTWNGVQNVPRSLIEVGTAFNASPARILNQIILPSVIPSIMTGLRIGIGKAVIGIVIAEFFTALTGLGGVIVEAGGTFQPDRMFAAVLVLSVIATGLTWLVGRLERRIAPWNHATTGNA